MYESAFSSFAGLALAALSSSKFDPYTKLNLDEAETLWVKRQIKARQRKAGRAIQELAKATGPWRRSFGYGRTTDRSDSLNRLLRKANSNRYR